MKPATPLPWNVPAKYPRYVEGGSLQGVCKTYSASVGGGDSQDASYIAHATNAYPKLVEALRELMLRCDGPEGICKDGDNIQTHNAHGLLRELGEEA